MAYTTHGHHIPGTILSKTKPTHVARCGGPGLCRKCRIDAGIFHAAFDHFTQGEEMADNLDANPQPPLPLDIPLQARVAVARYANDHFEITDGTQIAVDQTYVVWFCFILGGWKALVSTTLPDGKYYEVTHKPEHDGSDGPAKTFIDVYVKVDNKQID